MEIYLGSYSTSALDADKFSASRPVRFTPPPPRENTPVRVEQQAEWVPEPVWTFWRREIILPGDRPACSLVTVGLLNTLLSRRRCVWYARLCGSWLFCRLHVIGCLYGEILFSCYFMVNDNGLDQSCEKESLEESSRKKSRNVVCIKYRILCKAMDNVRQNVGINNYPLS
jgi:hypothetical protein